MQNVGLMSGEARTGPSRRGARAQVDPQVHRKDPGASVASCGRTAGEKRDSYPHGSCCTVGEGEPSTSGGSTCSRK